MNLLTEREYYKPFNYPWAYEHYKNQQHMHWLPDEVNLADDLKDYREKLTDGNKLLLTQIFRFFTQADVDVCCGYAKHYFCLLYTSPSPRDATLARMPSSA